MAFLQPSQPALEGSPPDPSPKLFKCGALQYTKFGLFMVFVWLLWGDFVWTLLDNWLPKILPLKLKDIGASDFTNQVFNKTFAYAMAFLFAPVVSFRSDRHRGRWGRRIPFLLWSTPFVGLFLVLIGCYDSLTQAVTGGADSVRWLGMVIPSKVVGVGVLGGLLIGYDFANIFVGTVYWYIFNDLVPPQFLSRFLSLFRIVSTLAGMLYSKYIFPNALSHFRVIFVVAGIAYVIGFMAMCFFVKEGAYPPPPPHVDKGTGLISAAKTFAKECFTHRLYWYFFLANMFTLISFQTSNFVIVRNRDSLGMSMKQIGDLTYWTMLVSLVLQYPCGWLSDRWNPIRVYTAAAVLNVMGALAGCVFAFYDFGLHGDLVYLYAISLVFLPITAIGDAAELPMYMRLLPKDRYGQFCSANAMVRAFALIFGSMLAGTFIQTLGTVWGMGEWRYRFVPVWEVVFRIPAAIFVLLLFREWKARGGHKGYTPPGVEGPAA